MSHYIDEYGNIYLPEYTINDYRASLMDALTMVNSKENSKFLMSFIEKNIDEYFKKSMSALDVLLDLQNRLEKEKQEWQ